MRILVCSLEAPLPPPNGLRVQVSALVNELRKEHQVRVLAYRMGDQADPGADALTLVPYWRERRPYLTFLSWGFALVGSRPPGVTEAALDLRPALQGELGAFRPDVVHVTSGRLARVGRSLRHRPAVLAALDAWHVNADAEATRARGMMRPLRLIEARMVRRFERIEYPRFARVVVVSDADRRALLDVQPALTVEVIPNGVDASSFDWDGTPRDRSLILFTGVMDYAPNVTAAEFLAQAIFPLVRRALPRARLALVGRHPSPAVRALERLDGVEVTGDVPSIRSWLSKAGAYACPMLSGTGIKNKLLEAMANALPCVATPLALQGIGASWGKEVLVGSDAEELAGHLVRVLSDPVVADRTGSAGRAYVTEHHTWGSVARQYVRVYEEVTSRG